MTKIIMCKCYENVSINNNTNDWNQIFDHLDKKSDGLLDGKIKVSSVLEWYQTLEINRKVDNEINLNISRGELEKLLKKADKNGDGYFDKCEFFELLHRHQRKGNIFLLYASDIAYADQYRCCQPPPIFITTVTIIQISTYIYHLNKFIKLGLSISMSGPFPECSSLVFNPHERGQFWRFFSYSLVHAGGEHIIFNMFIQLLIGLPLEMSHGPFRVAVIYFNGVIFGSLSTSALDPGIYLAGASGAIYALISAHIASLILNWKEDKIILQSNRRLRHGNIIRLFRLVGVMLLASFDVGYAFYERYFSNLEQEEGNIVVGYLAHIAGTFSGLLSGILVLKNRKRESWESYLKLICLIIFGICGLIILLINILRPLISYEMSYYLNKNTELKLVCQDYYSL